ncbi:MAG: hypothetical protein Q4E13_05500 [Clostridia bacterium]|nr:hypothetical protein [Clostridia bacterium]
MSEARSTLALMDAFERRGEDMSPRYDALLLRGVFRSTWRTVPVEVDLLIHRKPYDMPWFREGVTFTQLRRRYAGRRLTLDGGEDDALLSRIGAGLRKMEGWPSAGQCECAIESLVLRAQNSWNRSGYGRGTRYGETTPYVIDGVILRREEIEMEGSGE